MIKRVEALRRCQENLIGQSGVIPSVVSTSDVKMNESVGSRMLAANELEKIKRRIRPYELARQVLQNDGHLVSESI